MNVPGQGEKAVVLVSGGLDSTTVLAMAKAQGYDCHTLSFDYGQRHRSELAAARRVSLAMGVTEHKVVGLNLTASAAQRLPIWIYPCPRRPRPGSR
jgi:7-cyano-7-deazaguanine synthase